MANGHQSSVKGFGEVVHRRAVLDLPLTTPPLAESLSTKSRTLLLLSSNCHSHLTRTIVNCLINLAYQMISYNRATAPEVQPAPDPVLPAGCPKIHPWGWPLFLQHYLPKIRP